MNECQQEKCFWIVFSSIHSFILQMRRLKPRQMKLLLMVTLPFHMGQCGLPNFRVKTGMFFTL
jgi:hypothetical protein